MIAMPVRKMQDGRMREMQDMLAAEEPLEIRLGYRQQDKQVTKSISVTIRTPGNDEELSTGFLYTEGIVASGEPVRIFRPEGEDQNVICVQLSDAASPDTDRLERHFYTSSSCGVCGKTSIESVKTLPRSVLSSGEGPLRVSAELLCRLPGLLKRRQDLFSRTGGLHAAALFDLDGNLVDVREDVGRHNALDKLIGAAFREDRLPLGRHMLLLSGRASFELVQKAVMTGIRVVAAIGAPSSLAVELAATYKICLVGFLSSRRFNIYTDINKMLSV